MSETLVASKVKLQTVFVVDDDESICDGLLNLLEAVGISAKRYSTAESFTAHWTEAMAGCLLLDARLPGMSGVEFQERLMKSGIRIPVIFMTAHGDVPMVRKVMKAGAIEFLTKPFQKEELLQAVDHAFTLDRVQREEEGIVGAIRARVDSLTAREREVMALVTSGLLNKQIADVLNLREITVKLHRGRVMDKMRAGSLAGLVKMCERVKDPTWTARPQASKQL